jgi:small-conductance mechanosensitive channel
MANQVAGQVAKVKARTRPWRSIIGLCLTLMSLAAAEYGHYLKHHKPPTDPTTVSALIYSGAVAFFIFGAITAFGLSGQARSLLDPVIGAAHSGVARYALVLVGLFTALVVALNLASVPIGQLILGGAAAGVLLGIAAQQSLANIFAGMVLLFARPFRVGDRVRFRAGALSGIIEGTVTDVSLTYVSLETVDGPIHLPNSMALAAAVGPVPPPNADGSAAQKAATAALLTPAPAVSNPPAPPLPPPLPLPPARPDGQR